MSKKKIAICFSGQARALDFTYQSIKDNLLSISKDIDIFAYLKKDEYTDLFFKYFEPKACVVSDDPKIDVSMINWDERSRGSCETYMRMLWNRKKVNDLRVQSEINYDIVIHSRLDVKYYTSLDMFKIEQMDMNKLYASDFHSFSIVQGDGVNDRWAMSNESNMQIYFNLFDFILMDSAKGFKTHGESILARYLKENNIQVQKIPFRFSRVSSIGEERDSHIAKDKSFWKDIERE